MSYTFSWRRVDYDEWETLRKVVKHFYIPQADKLSVELEDGSLHEIPRWIDCELRLGPDFRKFQRDALAQPLQHRVDMSAVKEDKQPLSVVVED